AVPAGGKQEIPEGARRQLVQGLGPVFLVFRQDVQGGLKLSEEQKRKLGKRLQETVPDAMRVFEQIGHKKPDQREKEAQVYRQKADEKLAAFLKETLKDEQIHRLRQLELHQEGPFALFSRPDLGKELKVSDGQRKQFMAVVQELQKKIEPLLKEA